LFDFAALAGAFAVVGFGLAFAGVLIFAATGGDFFGAGFLDDAGVVFDFGLDAPKSLLLLPKSWLNTLTADSIKQTNKIFQLVNIKSPKSDLIRTNQAKADSVIFRAFRQYNS